MLHVTVENIDSCWQGVFEEDDRRKAALFALEDLVVNCGFFKDNVIVTDFPSYYRPSKNVVGMLMLSDVADDEDEVAYAIDDENTYWVTVREFVPNKMSER